jgi:hypothetical protein
MKSGRGIYGAYTSVEVSDPGVTDCGVGCGSWGRNLTISTQDGSQSASVGFEKNATGLSGTFCSAKAGLYAFLAYNSYTVCYSLQSGDVNNACSLEIEDRCYRLFPACVSH